MTQAWAPDVSIHTRLTLVNRDTPLEETLSTSKE
jgi:hypothetical protein